MSFYSLENNQLLYRGKRTVKTEGDQITEMTTFTTPAGKPIQNTTAIFKNSDLSPVRYQLNDLRSGETEELRRDQDTIFLAYRENREEDLDQDTVEWEPGSLFSSTVVRRIQREWDKLMRGGQVPFQLLVPSRQEMISFRVEKDEEKTAQAKERVVIRMEPDNWFFRRLVDPLYFYFETKPPYRVMEYLGRFSIKTDDGDDQDLRLTYHYLN